MKNQRPSKKSQQKSKVKKLSLQRSKQELKKYLQEKRAILLKKNPHLSAAAKELKKNLKPKQEKVTHLPKLQNKPLWKKMLEWIQSKIFQNK